MGQLGVAKDLLDQAKRCGCTYAKFQKRNPKELLTEEQYRASHPVPYNSYGVTYGEHREFLEFTSSSIGSQGSRDKSAGYLPCVM